MYKPDGISSPTRRCINYKNTQLTKEINLGHLNSVSGGEPFSNCDLNDQFYFRGHKGQVAIQTEDHLCNLNYTHTPNCNSFILELSSTQS